MAESSNETHHLVSPLWNGYAGSSRRVAKVQARHIGRLYQQQYVALVGSHPQVAASPHVSDRVTSQDIGHRHLEKQMFD